MFSESALDWNKEARAIEHIYPLIRTERQLTKVFEDIEDEPGNTTRFVWLAPAGTGPDESSISLTPWKTTLVFSELGADHPGALVDALHEFSDRDINLARIESRPEGRAIGRYRFFIDVEGRSTDEGLAAAIVGLKLKAESVQVLGSYRAA